jgi:hypothetical protein
MYLKPLNCTLKNGENGNVYVRYYFAIIKIYMLQEPPPLLSIKRNCWQHYSDFSKSGSIRPSIEGTHFM